MKKVYEIDGTKFDDLETFYDHIGEVLIPRHQWGRNLDAFNDILRGGFGTPDDGFVVTWKNSGRSQQKLGFPETVRYIEHKLTRCHPENRESVKKDLLLAQQRKGPTLFEILTDIIREHGSGGSEAVDGVELILT
ncbi:barstar family protein [Afipia sp. GAS231]|uniref:barstar family protein n=1 Tax=Afipia sp. GAS231 TaxID=1882747 RepID=UPI00087C31D0|nr:barstar family protein [Afipia sp. GAS231]SDO18825.1 Barstar, RNAse (barnase) inhibitor [Afipia sp. GAS231]